MHRALQPELPHQEVPGETVRTRELPLPRETGDVMPPRANRSFSKLANDVKSKISIFVSLKVLDVILVNLKLVWTNADLTVLN